MEGGEAYAKLSGTAEPCWSRGRKGSADAGGRGGRALLRAARQGEAPVKDPPELPTPAPLVKGLPPLPRLSRPPLGAGRPAAPGSPGDEVLPASPLALRCARSAAAASCRASSARTSRSSMECTSGSTKTRSPWRSRQASACTATGTTAGTGL